MIVQPFTQSSPELAVRSTPLLITLSDSSTEESEDSTSSGEDFVYPTSPDPLPTISPPVAQFANLRMADAPMRSPSPPAQHTFVLPPASGEDPEVNFLINLLHIRLTDIINSYKTGRRPALHIVESAPAPPYNPFTADRDDIYAEEPPRDDSASPVIHQPQPHQATSLPPVETLSVAVTSAPAPLLSPPPSRTQSHSPNHPVSPVIHLVHDTVGWNWTQPPSEGDESMNIVPYDTGHSLLEMEWPKVVPLDDNQAFESADTCKIEEPPHTCGQAYHARAVMQAIRRLCPNLEFLAKRAIGIRGSPIRAVRIRDQIPEPIFKRTFSQNATYADLETDLSDQKPGGARRSNRWLCYITRIRRVRQQFLELFAAAQELVKVHGYTDGLQIYIYMNQEEVNKWIKQHKPSPILHAHEFRFLCTFLHFLDQYSYHFLARHIHTFVHLRFSASYDLWSVLHLVMDRMEPSDGKYDFDYDSFPILNSPYSVLPMSPASNQSPSRSPVFT